MVVPHVVIFVLEQPLFLLIRLHGLLLRLLHLQHLLIEMVAEVTSRAEGSLEIPRGLARAEGALDIDLPSLLIVALMEETSEEHVVAPVVGVDAAVLVAEEQIIVTELSKFPSMSSPQIPIARPNANSDRCSSILWRSGRHGCRHGRGWDSTR